MSLHWGKSIHQKGGGLFPCGEGSSCVKEEAPLGLRNGQAQMVREGAWFESLPEGLENSEEIALQ